ncbi:hypothetical protein AK88_02002 [Plasmodium fragile]|uniref:AP2/ERF domain-containing protein n=1 Tax=Plasmodium fragile TaxID=5857 RepID=A0A0D9QRT0_PLAFR|nr:uncharacterized protein AK88_02002 [Plasmodium fragile]KJP88386.1 hypothetical protein AK88_02002 [Plasmodium fragile]
MDRRKYQQDIRSDELRVGDEETHKMHPCNVDKDYVAGKVKMNFTSNFDLEDKEKEVNQWGEKRGTHYKLNEDTRSAYNIGAADMNNKFESSMNLTQVNLPVSEEQILLSSQNDLHDKEREKEREKERQKGKAKDSCGIDPMSHINVTFAGGHINALSPEQQRSGGSKRIDIRPLEKVDGQRNPHDGGTSRTNINMNISDDQRRSGLDGAHISATREQYVNTVTTNFETWCNKEVSVNDQCSCNTGVHKEGAHLREAIRARGVGADDTAHEEEQKDCAMVSVEQVCRWGSGMDNVESYYDKKSACHMMQGGRSSALGEEEQDEKSKTNPIIMQGLNEVRRNNSMNTSGSYVDNGKKDNIYEESFVRCSNLQQNYVSEGHLDEENKRANVFHGDDTDWVSTVNTKETPPNVEDRPSNRCPLVKDIVHLRKNLHGAEKESKLGKSLQVGCTNILVCIGTEIKEKWTANAPNGDTPKLPEQVRKIDNELEITNEEIKNVGQDNLEGYKKNVCKADLEQGPNETVSHERVSRFPGDAVIGIVSSGKIDAPAGGGKNNAINYIGVENKTDAHLAGGNEEHFSCAERAVEQLDGAPLGAPPLRQSSQERRTKMGIPIRIGAVVDETAHRGMEQTAVEEEGKKKDRSPEMCKVGVDVSNELDDKSRSKQISLCRERENGFTPQDILSKSKYSTDNQLVGVIPRTLVSVDYTPDAHGVGFKTSRTRFGERKLIHMVDAKWSEGDKYIMDNYQRCENIPMGIYGNGHEEILAHRTDAYSSFEKEMNSALLDLHKDGVDVCQDSITHLSDCKKKKKRTGIPLNERKYYRVLAKQMVKIQGLTFDHNQIRWIAYWKNENNKQIQKHFPVCKYGFYKARQLALEFRNSKFSPGSQAVSMQAVAISEVDKPGVNSLGVEKGGVINCGVNPPQSSKKSSHKKDVARVRNQEPTQKDSQLIEAHTKNKRKDAKVGIHNPRKRSRISSRRVDLSVERGGIVANPSHAARTMKRDNEPKNVDAKSNLTCVNKRINACRASAYEENNPIGRSAVGSFSGGRYARMTRPDLKNVHNVLACESGHNLSSIPNVPHSTISQGFPDFMGNQVVGGLTNLSDFGGYIGGRENRYDQNNHTTTDGHPPNRHEFATGSYGSVNFYDQNGIIITGPQINAWHSEHGGRNNYTYMVNNFEAMPRGHNIAMSSCLSGVPTEVAYMNHGMSGEPLLNGQFTDTHKNVSNQLNPFFGVNDGRNLQTVTDAAMSSKWGGHTQMGNYIHCSNFNNADMKNEGEETYSPCFRGVPCGSPQHMRGGTYQYQYSSMNEGRTQNMGPHFNSAKALVDGTWNSPYEEETGANPSNHSTVENCVKNSLEGRRVRSSAISSGSCVGGIGSQGMVKTPLAILAGDNPMQNKKKEDLTLSLNVNMHSRANGERSERETWNLTRASTATHISEHLGELINVNRSIYCERSQGRSLPSEGGASGEVVGRLMNKGEESTRGKVNVLGDNAEACGRLRNSPEQWISIQPMEKDKTTIKNACVENGQAGNVACGQSVEGVTSAYAVGTTVGNPERKTSERNVMSKNKGKKNNSAKRTNTKGERSCNDSHIRENSISLVSESVIVSRSYQWNGEEDRGETRAIGSGEKKQGGMSREVSKTKSSKKSAKEKKKEKNELNVDHTGGKQNRNGCNQICDSKNKGSEEVSSALNNPNEWTHSMSLIQRKGNISEEPNNAVMYEERKCTSEKQLDSCGQLNQLSPNTPFSVSIGEYNVPQCVLGPSGAKNGERGREKGSSELGKKETGVVEEEEEEMYTYKLNELEKNTCNDQDEDEYYYNEIMKMPKIKGVHFDIRQKRWCAYGHKKKECFSVYRYGFLIARELAVKSRLKVQKRKNNMKLKKNKNYMNSENVCGKNGVSPVKKQKTVGDKQTHSTDNLDISSLPYDGLDRNKNRVSLNDYTSPPSQIGSTACTPTTQFNDQEGHPMGSTTPTGDSNSHEHDKQHEVMDDRIDMNANLFPIQFAHSGETESLKGPSARGSKLRPYKGSGASGTYIGNPYGGFYDKPDRYANRSYTGMPSEMEGPTRRHHTGEVGSKRGSGAQHIVPLDNMVHHSEKVKNCNYLGNLNRISNVNQAQEQMEFCGPNEQLFLNGEVTSDNLYDAYNGNGEMNQMIHSSEGRETMNFFNMRNVERCVFRGPNDECQSYNGDVNLYSVARANADMQKMGSVPIMSIPMGCIPVGLAPCLGNGSIMSNSANEEARNRFHRIAVMNDGYVGSSREQVRVNEVMNTQGGFQLGVGAGLPIDSNKTCVPDMQHRNRTNNRTHRNGITDGSRECVQNKEEVAIVEPVVESKPNRMRLKNDVVANGYCSFRSNCEKGTPVGSDKGGGTNLTANAVTCVNSTPQVNSGGKPFLEVHGGSIGGAANRIDGKANAGIHFLGITPSPQQTAAQNMLLQFPHGNSSQGQGPFINSWVTESGKNLPSAKISIGNPTQSACDTTPRINTNQWGVQKNRERQNDVGRVINMSDTNFLQNDMNRGVVENYCAVRSFEPYGAHNLMRNTTWRRRNVESDCAKGKITSCLVAEEKTNSGVGKEPHVEYDRNVAHIGSGYSEYNMNPCVDVNDSFAQNEQCVTLACKNYGGDAFIIPFGEEGKNETDKHLEENEKKFLHQIFQDNRNIGHIEVDIKNKPIESCLEKNKRLNFEEVNMFNAEVDEVREPVVSVNTAELDRNERRNERVSPPKWVQINGKAISYDKVDVGKTDREATNKGVKIMKREKKKKKTKEDITSQSVNHIFHSLDVANVQCEEKQACSDKNKRCKSGFANFTGSDETCTTWEDGAQTCLLPESTLDGNQGEENGVGGTQDTASNRSPIRVHMFKCHTNRSDAWGRRGELVGKYKCGRGMNAELSNSGECENSGATSTCGVQFKGTGATMQSKIKPKLDMLMLDGTTTGEEEEKYSKLYPRRRINFPLLQNKRSELICQQYDPYGGMVIRAKGGSNGNIKSGEEQGGDPLVFLKGTDKGGTENIICDDHGKVMLNGGLPYVDFPFTFSTTNGESPPNGIKCEQLKDNQMNPLEKPQTVRRFENRYGGGKSGHYAEEAANGLVLKNVDASRADLLHPSNNRSNDREVNRWDVLAGALRDGRFNGGFFRAAPNCFLSKGAPEKASNEDVHRFEADRMMAAAEVFLNRDYFDVCGNVPVVEGDTVFNGVISEVPRGGHSEWLSRDSRKRDNKKGTVLKNVHILREYGERFPHRGSEEGGVAYEKAVDGNTSRVDSLLDRYCLSLFGSMKISDFMPMHCGGTQIEQVLFVEPYHEYACLSLHDLNMNRAKDVNQTIHFKKLILKYLIMDLFHNISVPEFSKMTNDRTHFFVNPQKYASSYPLTNEVDKNRDLLQRVEKYHLKCVNNIYDMKFVQLYWDVFMTCLVKNVTASVLPFEEHCMVMRSLLLLYLESCSSGGQKCS